MILVLCFFVVSVCFLVLHVLFFDFLFFVFWGCMFPFVVNAPLRAADLPFSSVSAHATDRPCLPRLPAAASGSPLVAVVQGGAYLWETTSRGRFATLSDGGRLFLNLFSNDCVGRAAQRLGVRAAFWNLR